MDRGGGADDAMYQLDDEVIVAKIMVIGSLD